MPQVVSHIVDVYVFRISVGKDAEFLQLLRSPRERLGATWQSVHGRIESGESAWLAAQRELREETGLVARRAWQLETVNTFFSASDDAIHLCPSFAVEVDTAAKVQLNHEHSDFRWLPASQAERHFLWPGQRAGIREIREVILTAAPAEPHLRIAI